MRMPWPHASLSRRRAPASAAGLAGGAALPPAGASRAAAAPVRGPARVTAGEYANPAFWQDFAGIDVARVADTRCAPAPTTHCSPGAPVLRPCDPVHWEIAGRAVPVPDFGAKHDPT
ncbi:hypothetical protein [Streptomyces sp. DH37]|uniref:hypothetical protein n=1 Tax=Streptomyces sp. DH37 TaxID=3040122 RepID=UPI0030147EE2